VRVPVLCVWTDRPLPPHLMTAGEAARAGAFTGRRRWEFLTSRWALRVVVGLLGEDHDTNLYSFPHPRFSITHGPSGVVAAGAVSSTTAGVGVDLEPDRAVDARTTRFFLTEPERSWLAAVPSQAYPAEHLRLWTVKEAVFKSDPANRTTVLCDYTSVHPPTWQGRAWRRGSPYRFGYSCGRLRSTQLAVAVAVHDVLTHPTDPRRTMPVTFELVAERIGSTLNVPVAALTPQTTLRELAADSFLLVEMAVDLQEEFDAVFTQAQLREIVNLGQLVELLGTPGRG
jgi:acyl carrier protein/4'-phosphopantetheinyl transferase EntD